MDNDDEPEGRNPIDNLTPQQAQEALQNLWKQAFKPRHEILSDKNYPDLYQKVEALKQRLKKDYPDETFPEITVLKPGSFTNALASEKIKDALMAGKWGQYNVYGVNVPSEERNEEIAIHQWLIEKYPDAALGVIMHEYGHDARNIQYMPPEQRKTEECAADHFAAYYGGKEQLLEFLNIASGITTVRLSIE